MKVRTRVRRGTLLLAGLLAVATVGTAVTHAEEVSAAAERPNIIFFLVDDMSADLLPYMDNTRALANNGTRFTNYIVSDSLCCPSRASMFTGEFPHNTGVRTNLNSDNGGYAAFRRHEGRTYATALHGANYRTGYLGKYINEYQVPGDGFHVPGGWDEWHVQGRDGYGNYDFRTATYIREQNVKRIEESGDNQYLTDVLGNRAVNFVERSRQLAPNRPFFLQVAPFAPHSRLGYEAGEREPHFPAAMRDRPASAGWPGAEFPHGDCGGRDCGDIDVANELPAFNENTQDKPSWVRREALADGAVKTLREDFRNRIRMVQAVDDMVGRVVGALTPAERDDTFIVFSSDNGFHLGQHRLLRGKSTAYDHDVRVPLLVKRPGRAGNGDFVRDEVVQNVDLFATFLDMAGIGQAAQNSRDGRSLLGLIRNQNQPNWRDGALIEHRRPNPNAAGESDPDADEVTAAAGNSTPPTYRAIRTKSELFVQYNGGAREYYNLNEDPNQTTNRPNDPRADRLARALSPLADCGDGSTGCWAAAHLN
jgi:N-acetylglucosamine-6-sulfatase